MPRVPIQKKFCQRVARAHTHHTSIAIQTEIISLVCFFCLLIRHEKLYLSIVSTCFFCLKNVVVFKHNERKEMTVRDDDTIDEENAGDTNDASSQRRMSVCDILRGGQENNQYVSCNDMAPIHLRPASEQTGYDRGVWIFISFALIGTIAIASLVYRTHKVFAVLADDWRISLSIFLVWITMVACVTMMKCAREWQTNNQIILLLVLTSGHGLFLGILLLLAFHRIELFSIIVLIGLVLFRTILTLVPYGGYCCIDKRDVRPWYTIDTSIRVHISTVGIIIGVLCIIMIRNMTVAHYDDATADMMSLDDGWITLGGRDGTSLDWFRLPSPMWRTYVGVIMGGVQYIVLLLVYRTQATTTRVGQGVFVAIQVYTTTVITWQLIVIIIIGDRLRKCLMPYSPLTVITPR